MRFKITLERLNKPCLIPINYQYYLSAAIYKTLAQADNTYSKFLHEQGYQRAVSLKNFKLFTFSNLHIPYRYVDKKRLLIEVKSQQISFIASFYLSKASKNFIKGLFQNQLIQIADAEVQAMFQVSTVEALPVEIPAETAQFKTLSPVLVAEKQGSREEYLSPTDERFGKYLIHNIREKMRTIQANGLGFMTTDIEALPIAFKLLPTRTPKSKLITIKEGKRAETKLKGYLMDFELQTEEKEVYDLVLSAGVGRANAIGMGCLAVLETKKREGR
ncbi:MAG: CRISPR-associated endoribonuclease Cas6 [Thermonemataceae bacterium]